VSLIFAAAVFVGVLTGTGMIDAMGRAAVDVVPAGWGGAYGVMVSILSLPLTFVLSNDAYYFGVLPILAEAGAAHGLTPAEVARAALIGSPVHVLSPLVPALYLLVGRFDINLGDLQRKGLPWGALVALVMAAIAFLLGVVPLG
jgi:CitMHS family citrate-Mg2+:H+ or citrate-Ca2+:H+ symporter